MKKLGLKKIIIANLILTVLILNSCKYHEVDKFETILKIDNVELTKNQYVKKKNMFFGSTNTDALSKEKINAFNQSVIDECFLMADAYEKGFHQNDSILEIVDAMANFMLTKLEGFLWNHTKAKEVEVTEKEIEDIYNQPHVIYFLDAIVFNKRMMGDTLNNYFIETINWKNEFDQYYIDFKNNNNISLENYMSSWPVLELGKGNDSLRNVKVGDIIGPIRTLEGVAFAKLTKTDTIKKHPYKEESERLRHFYGMTKSNRIILEEQIKCENLCLPQYYNNTIEKFLKLHDEKEFQNEILAEYSINGHQKKLTVSEFNDYLKHSIYQFRMSSPMDVKVQIREKIGNDYLLVQVDSLNLRNDPLYIDEYNGFLGRLVISYYTDNILKPDLSNIENEVITFYNENLANYKEPEYTKVSCFEFSELGKLYESQANIQKAYITDNEKMLTDTSLIKGVKEFWPEMYIKRDSTFLNPYNYDMLLTLPINSLSNEFRENGKFYLFYKKQEEGETYRPFELAKEEIQARLTSEKIENEKQKILVKLKEKHAIEINKINEMN